MNASSAAQAARAFMTGPPVGELGLWHLRHNTVRPDAIGTDQPQPVDALGVGEIHGFRVRADARPGMTGSILARSSPAS